MPSQQQTRITTPAASDVSAGRPTGRLAWLDALRAIAALCVVAQHSFQETALGSVLSMGRVFDIGQYGVFVFFGISGLIIPRSIKTVSTTSGSGGRADLRTFWIKRFFRLWPAYWLSVAVAAVVFAADRLPASPELAADPVIGFGANFTMVHRAFGIPHVLSVYWTLWFELIFYAGVTAVAALGLLRHLPALAAGAVVASGGLGVAAVLGDVDLPQGSINLAAFAVGAAASPLLSAGQAASRPMVIGVLAAVVAGPALAVAALGTSFAPSTPGTINGPAMGITWLAALATIAVGFLVGSKAKVPKWLVRIGVISYSLYLFHLFVVFIDFGLGPLPTFALDVGISLLLSEIIFRLAESPAISMGATYSGKQWRRSV